MMGHASLVSPAVSGSRPARASRWALLAAALLAAALLISCQQAPDFGPYLRQASELIEGNTPRLDRLTRRLPELRARAAALADQGKRQGQAAQTATQAAIDQLLAATQRDAEMLRQLIENVPAKIGSAMKTGKAAEVQRTLALTRADIERRLTALRSSLDETSSEVMRAEAEAGDPRQRLPTPTAPTAPAP